MQWLDKVQDSGHCSPPAPPGILEGGATGDEVQLQAHPFPKGSPFMPWSTPFRHPPRTAGIAAVPVKLAGLVAAVVPWTAKIALVLVGFAFPPPVHGEASSPASRGTPAQETARAYLDAVERMDWRGMADHLHPDALADFRRYVEIVLFRQWDPWDDPVASPPPEAAGAGPALEALTGAASLETYRELDDASVLRRALAALARDSPGMMNAWVERTTQVLGAVPEGADLTHVVYRLEWHLSGATSDVEILTLARVEDEGWGVLESRELESLRPAILAVIRRAESPPIPSSGSLDSAPPE
ncbi:MAG: hypothetical protein EA422_07305 [Gemmatimonadales bacterium]|nr:MAG: hypothetical protein EA422_07305 [Gemmatimonadales bacterium]